VPAQPERPVLVRTALAGELDAVGRLTVRAYAPFISPTSPYRRRLADAADRAANASLLVAVDAASPEPLGTATLVVGDGPYAELAGPGEAELRMLAVDPAARRRGVGAALVRAVLDRARAGGARRVLLSTMPAMEEAQRLYRRFGFARAPDLDHRPAPGVRLLAFTLDLPPPDSVPGRPAGTAGASPAATGDGGASLTP
jgi:ribosomal protein S18 acetylase RimI-like enzyme